MLHSIFAQNRRRWLVVYAALLSGGVGLGAGWLIDREAQRRGVPPARLAWVGGLWVLAWSMLTHGTWVATYVTATAALLGFFWWPAGGLSALLAGWTATGLFIAAALPRWRASAQPQPPAVTSPDLAEPSPDVLTRGPLPRPGHAPAPRLTPAPAPSPALASAPTPPLSAAPDASPAPGPLVAPAPLPALGPSPAAPPAPATAGPAWPDAAPAPSPPSAPVPSPDHRVTGVELGRDWRGQAVLLTLASAGTGVMLLGAPGSGKTNVLLTVGGWALGEGFGVVAVDGKGSPDFRGRVQAMADRASRPLQVWSFNGPHRYNPLAHGLSTELRDKLIAVESWSEVHYRRAAERYLGFVLRALQTLGRTPTLDAVVELLDPEALRGLTHSLPDAEGRRLFNYVTGLDGSGKSAVAGLANRVATLIESEAGPWLCAPLPGRPSPAEAAREIDLQGIALSGGAALFSLDSLRMPDLAAQVGALLFQDLKTLAADRLAVSDRQPLWILVDEFNIFNGGQILGLLNKGREAGLCTVLATQDLADVEAAGGRILVDQLLANTNVKIMLRQDVAWSAERLAGALGTRRVWNVAHRTEDGARTGEGTARIDQEPVLDPSLLLRLPPHQAVISWKAPEPFVRRARLWPAP